MMSIDYAAYERPRNYAPFLIIPVVGVIAILAGTGLSGGVAPDATALVLLVLLTLLAIPIFSLAARAHPEDRLLFPVLILAWIARLVGLGVKLYIFYAVAGGVADAASYHAAGEGIMQDLLATGALPSLPRYYSTQFVELVTGLMYVVTGPTLVGGWIVFTFLGLMGMLLHYRAFVTALPNGNRRLFMALIFFAPTLVLWTNTVGKDALIAFFLGMVTYGVASLYRRGLRAGPLVLTLLGLAGATAVRPHIGAMVATALTAAIFLQPMRAGALGVVLRLVMVAAVAVLAVVVIRTSAEFVNLEELSVEGVIEFAQEEGGTQTESGTLAFESGGFPTTPRGVVQAVLTVVFRPFPWEAGNLLILGAGLEGAALLGLFLYRWRSVGGAFLDARRHSYLIFVTVFALLFIVLFSPIANFGILIRQRAQLLPFILVWLAYKGLRQAAGGQEAGARMDAA